MRILPVVALVALAFPAAANSITWPPDEDGTIDVFAGEDSFRMSAVQFFEEYPGYRREMLADGYEPVYPLVIPIPRPKPMAMPRAKPEVTE